MEFTFANENEKMKMLDQRFNFARLVSLENLLYLTYLIKQIFGVIFMNGEDKNQNDVIQNNNVDEQKIVSPSINNINVLEEDIVGDLLTTDSDNNEKSVSFIKLFKDFFSSIIGVFVAIYNLVTCIIGKVFGFTLVRIAKQPNKNAARILRRKMIVASFDIVIFLAIIYLLHQLIFTELTEDSSFYKYGLIVAILFHYLFAFLISNVNKAGEKFFLREDNKKLDYVAEFSFVKTNWNYQWIYLILISLLASILLLPAEMDVYSYIHKELLFLLIDQVGFILFYIIIFAYLYMFRRFATVFIALGKYKKDEIPADISGRRPSFVPKILAGFITIGLNVYLLISIYLANNPTV